MGERKETGIERRAFMKTAAATSAGLLVMKGNARTVRANAQLELGIIGCGGRGKWIAGLFEKHTDTKVVAVHDYFADRIEAMEKRFDVPRKRQYTGLDGYRALLESKVDAVAIISPPYFHPEQTVAALEAGKHVYLAKPIAVDVPGCTTIVDAAKKTDGRQSMLVDFQTRNNEFYRGAAQRVHDGILGEIVCGQVYYHTGRLGVQTAPGGEPARLRNWVFDKALSGDIIVEQNIHVLDVGNWLLQAHPVKAHGSGGRKARTDVGDCWDTFTVDYWYPNGVMVSFSSSQCINGYDDLCARIFGSLGTVDTHYGGDVRIRGKKEGWRGGSTTQIYGEGAINNIKDFHQSIAEGKYLNNAEESARSTLTSILGRTAAYAEQTVTWDEMIAANIKIDAKLDLPKDGPSHRA